MTFKSLSGAAGLLRRHPVLWSVGIVMGVLAVIDLVIPLYGGTFYAEPLALLQSGKTYYFRILLPALLIFFAVILTAFLLAIPLTLLGAGAASGTMPLLLGVLVSIVFFTFFYDTVAVFEETNVFESIRRSVEFVMNNLGSVLVFYLVNIVVLVGIGFAAFVAIAALLVDRLEPLTRLDPAELQAVTPQDLLGLIGTEGIWTIAAVYAVVIVLLAAFILRLQGKFLPRPCRKRPHTAGRVRREGPVV